MKRRAFITALGGALAWPLAARAQQGERTRRVGLLMGLVESDLEAQSLISRIRRRLEELGWSEGRNIRIEDRWTAGATPGPSFRQAGHPQPIEDVLHLLDRAR
jgi:Fe2+ transport system protein FeoA